MKKTDKPITNPQRGYVVVWACFLIASISLTVQWKHAELKLRDERQHIAEETFRLRTQISSIQNDLTRCLNQIQRGATVAQNYPATPPSGLLRDVVCPYTPTTTTPLWSAVNFLKLKPSAGFTDWRYANTGNGFTLKITSTEGNRASIAALQRVNSYVLPTDAAGWAAHQGTLTAPPNWLGSRVQISSDGINSTMTISSGQ
ncbi:MAG: hypothetical protein LW629_07770 [Burkholderiales bacterium]|jgi:hypothetical protein|nr:hypothetical protein [Burkholderiales bacterium]